MSETWRAQRMGGQKLKGMHKWYLIAEFSVMTPSKLKGGIILQHIISIEFVHIEE